MIIVSSEALICFPILRLRANSHQPKYTITLIS
jgi:hypothetical protein